MTKHYVDLHVHVGRNREGKRVKIAGAANLTFENIAIECSQRKGISLIAIVDAASPRVISDIDFLLDRGDMVEMPDGGISYMNRVTLILGAELESPGPEGGSAHFLSYMPTLDAMKAFSKDLSKTITNISISTQRSTMTPIELSRLTSAHGGLFVISHAFTPHKGLYGCCVRRMSEVFGGHESQLVHGVELGLSADTYLADRIGELAGFTFLSNSDAHSLGRLGREYNVVQMQAPSFTELAMALQRVQGRHVSANYGLDPRLGKYHHSQCLVCEHRFPLSSGPEGSCPNCHSMRIVVGVYERVSRLADWSAANSPPHRPPYHYQVPLEFVPGLGDKSIAKLIAAFGSEMAILHNATESEIASVVGSKLAQSIIMAREGKSPIQEGGGGRYGRVISPMEEE